jgi:hypothetical protein
MLNMRKNITALACALTLAASSMVIFTIEVRAAPVATTKQGLQQWRALNGKLILIAGTYQDTTTYKRSLTFFFEEKTGGEWLHVPVIESEADHTLTWFSISAGDATVADAVVTTQDNNIYVIIAERTADKGGIRAVWYKLVSAGEDFPDGPAHLFKSISNNAYPKTKLTIEEVLKKETALKARNDRENGP